MIKNHGYTLAITNASVSDVLGLNLQPALSANAKVKAIAIVDTTDNIANNLDALQRVGLRIKSIAQTDAATPLEITGTQYKNDKAVIGKIITSDLLAVMDASATCRCPTPAAIFWSTGRNFAPSAQISIPSVRVTTQR